MNPVVFFSNIYLNINCDLSGNSNQFQSLNYQLGHEILQRTVIEEAHQLAKHVVLLINFNVSYFARI